MGVAITAPDWYLRMQRLFRSSEAHAFIVSGDLGGYVEQTVPPRRFLERSLAIPRTAEGREVIVASYHPSVGIQFVTPEMREWAVAILNAGRQAATQTAAQRLIGQATGSGGQGDPFDAVGTAPLACLRILDRLLRSVEARNQVAVLIHEADLVCPDIDPSAMSPDGRAILAHLKLWARDDQMIYEADNLIALLTEQVGRLHADLRSASTGYRSIDIPMPDEARRAAFLRYWLSVKPTPIEGASGPSIYDGSLIDGIARLTAGLNLRHLEEILLDARQAGGLTRAMVKARKDEIIASAYSEIAEMLEPLPGGLDDLGGLEWVKAYLRNRVIRPIEDGRLTEVPKGILLVGPPGTGKTYSVRALAGEVNMNCVALRMEKIQNSLVGASERALAAFFKFSVAVAPVIILVDEFDQSDLSKRGQGSGNPVAANMFNQFLQFMSDETLRGRVIVIFGSNRPDLLDAAVKRSGRIDAILPILLPDADDRAAIADRQAARLGAILTPGARMVIANGTDRYSAADVAAVVTEAHLIAQSPADRATRLDDSSDIDIAAAQAALLDVQPDTPTSADFFEQLAVQACNRRSLLPPRYQAMLDDRGALERSIQQVAPTTIDYGPRGSRY